MSAQLTVLAGPAGSGKTERLLQRYRQALTELPIGSCLWLAPTRRACDQTRERLLASGLQSCFQPGIQTFEQFANVVLQASPEPVQLLSPVLKRQLVARLIHDAHREKRLKHFAGIAHTGGLVDLVCEWISELKRLEIWPEHFRDACQQGRTLKDKDRELCELYERYQRELLDHHMYDEEGRFWSARFQLRENRWHGLSDLRFVVADAFADFTKTQHEILQMLGTRASEIQIALPLENGPRKDNLFSKPQRTLTELKRRFPALEVHEFKRPETSRWPALSHIERELFKNPRDQQPATDTARVEVIAAAQEVHELESLGRRIKHLLVHGDGDWGPVRPQDIVVVFRSVRPVAALVREVFTELGIPFALEHGPAIEEAPGLRRLLAWLQVQETDWGYRELLAALGSNYFQPNWPEATREAISAATLVIHHLGIPAGKERLLQLVTRLAAAVAEGEPALRESVPRAEAALALPLLQKIAATLELLPAAATLVEWGAALHSLADQVGWTKTVESSPAALRSTVDQAAWNALRQTFTELEAFERRLGVAAPQTELKDLRGRLNDLLRNIRLPPAVSEPGRVRILSAASVRGLQIPYLFCAGLSERSFPTPHREDALYTEPEARELLAAGLPWVQREDREQDEMLLFYELLTRAKKRLILSYPALDAKAQPLLPSPFLTEIEWACGNDKEGQPRLPKTGLPDLTPAAANPQTWSGAPAGPRHWRVQAIARAGHREGQLLAALVTQGPSPAIIDNVLCGLEVNAERSRRDHWGPYEGLLQAPAIQAWVTEHFQDKTWSPYVLELYAQCPYRFYLEEILKLQPLDDLELVTDHLLRGKLLHEALARVLRQEQAEVSAPAIGSPSERFRKRYQAVVEQMIASQQTDDPLRRAILEIERRQLTDLGEQYFEQHQEYVADHLEDGVTIRPAHFEVSFGSRDYGDGERDALSVRQPLELEQDGERIKIAGRIDRIDLARVGTETVFNIVDYKTGSGHRYTKTAIQNGQALQLPLYTLAAQEVLLAKQNAKPLEAGYWLVKDKGFDKALVIHKAEAGALEQEPRWNPLRAQLITRVFEIVHGIRAAEYVVASSDDDCTRTCPFRTVCRIGQVRALEKSWPPAPPT